MIKTSSSFADGADGAFVCRRFSIRFVIPYYIGFVKKMQEIFVNILTKIRGTAAGGAKRKNFRTSEKNS